MARASLLLFVVFYVTGVNVSEPINTIMALLLPVLVAFGIINDPTVHGKLFGNGGQ